MTEDKILETVKNSETANLYEDLGLDSLDSVDLIVCLENEFKFKVDRVKDGQRLKEMHLVKDILEYINEKISAATA